MSDIDTINKNQLKILVLPGISQEERGWDDVLVDKMIHLMWPVAEMTTPLVRKTRAASAITTGGAVFQAPEVKRWFWQFGIITFVASAVVGVRAISIDLIDTTGASLMTLLTDAPTAGQTRTYSFGPHNTSPNTVHRQLAYPIQLEQPQFIQIQDTANIDGPGDTVSWRMGVKEYQAI